MESDRDNARTKERTDVEEERTQGTKERVDRLNMPYAVNGVVTPRGGLYSYKRTKGTARDPSRALLSLEQPNPSSHEPVRLPLLSHILSLTLILILTFCDSPLRFPSHHFPCYPHSHSHSHPQLPSHPHNYPVSTTTNRAEIKSERATMSETCSAVLHLYVRA